MLSSDKKRSISTIHHSIKTPGDIFLYKYCIKLYSSWRSLLINLSFILESIRNKKYWITNQIKTITVLFFIFYVLKFIWLTVLQTSLTRFLVGINRAKVKKIFRTNVIHHSNSALQLTQKSTKNYWMLR